MWVGSLDKPALFFLSFGGLFVLISAFFPFILFGTVPCMSVSHGPFLFKIVKYFGFILDSGNKILFHFINMKV